MNDHNHTQNEEEFFTENEEQSELTDENSESIENSENSESSESSESIDHAAVRPLPPPAAPRRVQTGDRIRRMVMIAMFTAMSYVALLAVHIKIGGFLTLDVKDAVITLCGLYFGPQAALFIAVLVPLIEMVTVSTTGVYGLVMNIIGSVSFAVTASAIYKYKKTFAGALIGLASGAAVMTAMMLLFNLIVTPRYFGMPVAAVREMIPTLLLPFNLTKAAVNVGIVLMLYKSLSRALKKLRMLPYSAKPQAENAGSGWRTVFVALAGLVLIIGAMIVIFTVLGGQWGFGKESAGSAHRFQTIKDFFIHKVGAHWGVFFCAMIPVIELRGAIPLGMALDMPWWQSYLFAVIGNMIPVPFVLLFITKLIALMQKSRVRFFNKIGDFLTQKAEKNREKIEKYSFFGVCLFVAIPLPVTGAWTGSLVASTIGMKFWKALLSCFLGVLIAGAVVTLIAYGSLAAFQWLIPAA